MRTPRFLIESIVLGLALLTLSGCPNKPKYPSCDGDKDCLNGEKCIDKRCVQCGADADCPDGLTCQAGACRAPTAECTTSADCPFGKVCKDGSCAGCAQDSDCDAGETCREGSCVGPGECLKDEDCAEEEDCINNRCAKASAATTDGPGCDLGTVYFEFDKASITAQAGSILERNVECMNKAADRKVALEGFADSRGPDEYNIALSDQRAQTVKDFLTRLGIDGGRLRVSPQGESGATGADESGWAQDRRVELKWD